MKQTVLIAEDEPSCREALRSYLERQGLQLRIAADGQEAIAFLERERPDLVVLDLLMPKADGLEVLRRLRMLYADVPVLVITNLSRSFNEEKLFALGVKEILIKSDIGLKQLAEQIRGHLSI